MIKKLILLLLITSPLLAKALQINNYIDSNYDKSILKEDYKPTKFDNDDILSNGYSFPLQSSKKFKNTLANYLLARNKKQSLLFYQDDSYKVEGHVLGGFDYSKSGKDNYTFTYWGFEFNGQYQNLSINGHWWKGHTSTNDDYSQSSYLVNSWVQKEDDTIYIDKMKGDITYNFNENSYASIRRDKIEVGSNIGGSIILSDENTNDYGFLNYSLEFGHFNLDFVHASLVCDSTRTDGLGSINKHDAPDKYLAMHSFSWNPSEKFNIFFGEQIFYGNRNIDINYLIPLGFWRIVEHNQGDRGNVLIFGGLNYMPTSKDLIYSNAIFDELSKSKLFTSWWGNKYAFQLGYVRKDIIQSSLFSMKNVGIEFTAIRPWLYTHKYLYTKVSNDNTPLGFPDGTNLIKYTIEANFSLFNDYIDYCANASYIRQGSEANSYDLNYTYEIDDIDNSSASWLEGDINDILSIKNEVNFNILYSHNLKLSLELVKENDQSFDKELVVSYHTKF